jgi:hypothetical protein
MKNEGYIDQDSPVYMPVFGGYINRNSHFLIQLIPPTLHSLIILALNRYVPYNAVLAVIFLIVDPEGSFEELLCGQLS